MIFQIGDALVFPPVELANEDGMLCFGGDLSTERLILAYKSGIFPWHDRPVVWFSPDPRMIIDLKNWKPSKSLLRTLKKTEFEIKADTAFLQVIEQCADTRDDTWISEEFIESYLDLHEIGIAHSIETWHKDQLVGGLYGVSIGSAFFGESMFHTETDASKIAFATFIKYMENSGFTLLDCQISNSHLVRMGGIDIPRDVYMEELGKAINNDSKEGLWTSEFDEFSKTLKW